MKIKVKGNLDSFENIELSEQLLKKLALRVKDKGALAAGKLIRVSTNIPGRTVSKINDAIFGKLSGFNKSIQEGLESAVATAKTLDEPVVYTVERVVPGRTRPYRIDVLVDDSGIVAMGRPNSLGPGTSKFESAKNIMAANSDNVRLAQNIKKASITTVDDLKFALNPKGGIRIFESDDAVKFATDINTEVPNTIILGPEGNAIARSVPDPNDPLKIVQEFATTDDAGKLVFRDLAGTKRLIQEQISKNKKFYEIYMEALENIGTPGSVGWLDALRAEYGSTLIGPKPFKAAAQAEAIGKGLGGKSLAVGKELFKAVAEATAKLVTLSGTLLSPAYRAVLLKAYSNPAVRNNMTPGRFQQLHKMGHMADNIVMGAVAANFIIVLGLLASKSFVLLEAYNALREKGLSVTDAFSTILAASPGADELFDLPEAKDENAVQRFFDRIAKVKEESDDGNLYSTLNQALTAFKEGYSIPADAAVDFVYDVLISSQSRAQQETAEKLNGLIQVVNKTKVSDPDKIEKMSGEEIERSKRWSQYTGMTEPEMYDFEDADDRESIRAEIEQYRADKALLKADPIEAVEDFIKKAIEADIVKEGLSLPEGLNNLKIKVRLK